MGNKRAYVLVDGTVQGVGYRHFTHQLANSLGLAGYVKNLWDGRVEAIIEGDEDSLYCAICEMKKGPYMSVVENIDIEWSDYTGEFFGFAVRF